MVQFEPLPKLLVNKRYVLVVDLAAIAYDGAPGVYHSKVSDPFGDWLTTTREAKVELEVLLLPDEKYFRPQRVLERSKKLVVDVAAMRLARERGFSLDRPAFDYLQAHANVPFSFGRMTFTIETKTATGIAAIGLSFWSRSESNDGSSAMFPIDELSVPICVATSPEASCPSVAPGAAIGFRGPPLQAAAERKEANAYPDAALQIVELDSRTVIGVFRCNSCSDWRKDEFHTWWLAASAIDLSDYLSTTITAGFEKAAATNDSGEFQRAGEGLYRIIFDDGSGQQSTAERKFLTFVADNQTRRDPSSIFMRLVSSSPKPVSMVPLGLLSVPSGNIASGFLGLNFLIESPLELQDYAMSPSCISRWVLLVPPEDPRQPEMESARSEFLDWIDFFSARQTGSALYEDMGAFGRWIGPVSQIPPDPSTAIVIVSHYDNNRLFFNKEAETPSILSANVTRHFASPSVAIINACGTAKPGAFDLVRQLNHRGVNSVIATATAVDSRMSGRFLSLLMNNLRDHANDQTYTLGRAKFDAVRALSGEPSYGLKGLIYSLIGNSLVRLCPTNVSSP